MNKKFIAIITFAIALATSCIVYAQESDKNEKQEDRFSERKSDMIKELTAEKSGVEQVLGCVNSAQKQEDMKKCYELKKENMEKMHTQRRAERKERLQKELKKIDEEDKNPKK